MNPASSPNDPPVVVESAQAAEPALLALLDRDRSLLAFNERVLAMVTREDVPLLERLRYL